jgi:hypothetical protein
MYVQHIKRTIDKNKIQIFGKDTKLILSELSLLIPHTIDRIMNSKTVLAHFSLFLSSKLYKGSFKVLDRTK